MTSASPWMKGAPLRTGVHVASANRDSTCRRFWNGEAWSAPWFNCDGRLLAERAIRTMGESQTLEVEWLEGPHQPLPWHDEPTDEDDRPPARGPRVAALGRDERTG